MKRIVILVVFIGLVLLAGSYLATQRTNTRQSDKPRVATTIFPLYDITRQIAGDSIQVELILAPGASPHTYDARPSDIKRIQNSDILFMIGHGIDDWSVPVAEAAGINDIVTVDKNIFFRTYIEDGTTGNDPHYWLSGENGILMAAQIRDELTRMYPDTSTQFQDNFLHFESNVQNVNTEIEKELSNKNTRSIATFHNAWGYFADAYGLTISTTFEEFPGETPSPAYLKSFGDSIQKNSITSVFVEPQFSTKQLKPIASDLGVEIRTIDPIGGTESIQTYTDLLLYNGIEISKAL